MSDYPKTSLVMAVYNEDETLSEVLDAVQNIDYPKESYELIVVSDGSTDNSIEIINSKRKKYLQLGLQLQLIKLDKNVGRIKARMTGVNQASHQRIVILDGRSFPTKNYLREIAKYPTNTNLITNYCMHKYRSMEDRVLYLLRKKHYTPYWGTSFPEVRLDKNNFNQISKGTGGFVTQKDKFLIYSSQLQGKKTENEDTKLFWLYLNNNEEIIRTPHPKIIYKNRTGINSLRHIYKRGPRYVDFYFNQSKHLWLLAIVASLLLLSGIIYLSRNPGHLLALLAGLLLTNLIISIYFSEELSDLPYMYVYTPIIVVVFFLGISKGILNQRIAINE